MRRMFIFCVFTLFVSGCGEDLDLENGAANASYSQAMEHGACVVRTTDPGYAENPVAYVQRKLDGCSVVAFAPGTYELSADVPYGGVLEIDRAVVLEALDPAEKPRLVVTNTAFVGNNYDAYGVVVNVPGGFVALDNLHIESNRSVEFFALDGLRISDCHIEVYGPNAALWFSRGPITGRIDITGNRIVSQDDDGIGFLRDYANPDVAFEADIHIEDNPEIVGGGTYGIFIVGHMMYYPQFFDVFMDSDFTVRRNTIRAGCGLWLNGFGGDLDWSHNEVIIDRLPWWGVPAAAWIVDNNPQTSRVSYSQNTVHMDAHADEVIAFATGIVFGPYMRPAYDVVFNNNRIDGESTNVVWAYDSHGCSFVNNDRSDLALHESGAHYLLFPNSSGNRIIDNAVPRALVLDMTDTNPDPDVYEGRNILLGRLQHLYSAEGNAAEAMAQAMIRRLAEALAQ